MHRRRTDEDLAEEIRAHIALEIDRLVAEGMDPAAAKIEAARRFGNVTTVTERFYESRRLIWFDQLKQDLRYAARVLYKRPVFTAVAVLSLAVGIGANTALYSVVNNLILRQLAVPHPDELVAFQTSRQDKDMIPSSSEYGYSAPDPTFGAVRASFTHDTFEQFRSTNATLSQLAAFAESPALNVVVNGEADLSSGQYVSGGYFGIIGIGAWLGRTILETDDNHSAAPVVVISHSYWVRRFSSAPGTVGRQVSINGVSFTVIGITPPGFANMERIGEVASDISIPLSMEPRVAGARSRFSRPWNWWLLIFGRLKPGTTTDDVQRNFAPAFRAATQTQWYQYLNTLPADRRPSSAIAPQLRLVSAARGIYDANPRDVAPLPVLAGLFSAFLLIVCLNIANLMLSRSIERQREAGVRHAIGASRARLIRQWLTESIVLSLSGAVGGIVFAFALLGLFRLYPAFETVQLDAASIMFAMITAIIVGLLFGLLSMFRVGNSRRALVPTSAGFSTARSRLGQVLVVVQIAVTLVLLTAAGLLLRTLIGLHRIPFGFNTSNVILFSINPSLATSGIARSQNLNQRIVERVGIIPGVQSVAFSSLPQIGGGRDRSNNWLIDAGNGTTTTGMVYRLTVSPTFFETLDIPFKIGRGLEVADETGPPVAVVNETFVQTYLRDGNTLSARVGASSDSLMQIVGVVADARYGAPREPSHPTVYMPFRGPLLNPRTFELKTLGAPDRLLPAVREAIRSIDPTLPLQNFSTQQAAIDQYASNERMFAVTLTAFGTLALMVSMIGMFGLMSCVVAQRNKEIGIRMALGADRSGILRSVLQKSTKLILAGGFIGIAGALATTRFLESLLYDVTPTDPATIGCVLLLVICVSELAAYVPARRAARVDPLVALRQD